MIVKQEVNKLKLNKLELELHINRTGCSSYLIGVKKVVLVALRVFSLKRSTALAVPFKVLSRKIMTGDI